MKITVSATLNEEQIDILAKQKGYQETFQETNVETNEVSNYPNPQSKEDFIRQVYEGIILADATREYISYANSTKENERIAYENSIREQVASSITSNIE